MWAVHSHTGRTWGASQCGVLAPPHLLIGLGEWPGAWQMVLVPPKQDGLPPGVRPLAAQYVARGSSLVPSGGTLPGSVSCKDLIRPLAPSCAIRGENRGLQARGP